MKNKIICSKCETLNNKTSKFCTKCGSELTVELNAEETITENKEINIFKYMLDSFLKPYDAFKKEEENLNNFKNSGLIAGILILVLTLFKVFSNIISNIFVKNFWTGETTLAIENIKNVHFIKIIFSSLATYSLIIFAITGVYYLANLVIKKETTFSKILSTTITAFIPLSLTLLISSIISIFSSVLSIIIFIIGLIYSFVILIELINEVVSIEDKNLKIYYHLTCLSILIIVGGYLLTKSAFTPTTYSSLKSLF